MIAMLVGLNALYLVAFILLFTFAVLILRRRSRLAVADDTGNDGVSVILPIKGLDPGAYGHYEGWLTQNPGVPYEVIFSLQDPEDPVLPVLHDLLARYPRTTAQIIVNSVVPSLNGKASNLHHGVQAALHPRMIMADSDIVPHPGVIRQMIPSLNEPDVGAVCAIPVAGRATNFWGGVNALTINITLAMQWPVLHRSRVLPGSPGACFAIRREVLERIGGVPAFGAYVAEDARMGQLLEAHGYDVRVGPAVTLEQGDGTLKAAFSLLLRGAYMAKHMFNRRQQVFMLLYSLPAVMLALGLVMGDALLIYSSLIALGGRWVACALFHLTANRCNGWRQAMLVPVLEGLTLAAVVRSLVASTVRWRGVTYRVHPGGRMERTD